MTIAILGTGNMAKGLAAVFSNAGYDVVLGSREPAAVDAGAKVTVAGIAEAAQQADTVVLAVPFEAARDVIAAAG